MKKYKLNQKLHTGSTSKHWKQNNQICFLNLPAEPLLETLGGFCQIAIRVKHIEHLLSIHTLLQD